MRVRVCTILKVAALVVLFPMQNASLRWMYIHSLLPGLSRMSAVKAIACGTENK
jgi:hypothetical protein